MSLSKQDVEKIAALARLELTPAEKDLYQDQLSSILEYAASLNQLDLDGIQPTASAVALQNVLRDDEVLASLSIEEVLFNAPRQAQNQFQIQTVLDDD
jgi:aspartyl-tRNA(Asn)/glutamyl-tRNA(Gln) amidotransferase subunit C